MGLLNRQDSKIFRQYFNEMVKLIGQSVGYQYVVDRDMTIHSEDNSTYLSSLSVPGTQLGFNKEVYDYTIKQQYNDLRNQCEDNYDFEIQDVVDDDY